MTPPVAVGNDVVDLADPRCVGRASDTRFVARIFDPGEARAIEAADDPDLALWLRWAAKEAAFKVVSKLSGSPPPFRHAAFVSELDAPGPGDAGAAPLSPRVLSGRVLSGRVLSPRILSGRVRYGTREISLRARVAEEWLHVLAVPGGEAFEGVDAGVAPVADDADLLPDPGDASAWASFLEARFSAAERPSIHSAPSALVRLRAREALCGRLGEAEGAVEIVCRGGPTGRTPPEVLVRGGPGRADVSLSHHGRWVGWAVTAG